MKLNADALSMVASYVTDAALERLVQSDSLACNELAADGFRLQHSRAVRAFAGTSKLWKRAIVPLTYTAVRMTFEWSWVGEELRHWRQSSHQVNPATLLHLELIVSHDKDNKRRILRKRVALGEVDTGLENTVDDLFRQTIKLRHLRLQIKGETPPGKCVEQLMCSLQHLRDLETIDVRFEAQNEQRRSLDFIPMFLNGIRALSSLKAISLTGSTNYNLRTTLTMAHLVPLRRVESLSLNNFWVKLPWLPHVEPLKDSLVKTLTLKLCGRDSHADSSVVMWLLGESTQRYHYTLGTLDNITFRMPTRPKLERVDLVQPADKEFSEWQWRHVFYHLWQSPIRILTFESDGAGAVHRFMESLNWSWGQGLVRFPMMEKVGIRGKGLSRGWPNNNKPWGELMFVSQQLGFAVECEGGSRVFIWPLSNDSCLKSEQQDLSLPPFDDIVTMN